MSPESLQVTVLTATAAVLVIVPLLIVLLASRVRNAAHETTRTALAQSRQQHEQALGEFTRQYDRSLGEFTRQHERSIGEYARQHERVMAELAAEHKRIAQELGMFSQKRHEVYARLYARYRRATHDLTAALHGHEPDFRKFSRDDLLRFVQRRDIREREANDAIAAMDRGDLFAMSKLMTRLHWRTLLRDAEAAFERARRYEALNELYLSESVLEAVGKVRGKVEALTFALSREQERADPALRTGKQDELHSAIASLLHAMREDLRAGSDGKPRPRPELDRTPPRNSLPARASLADKAVPVPAGSGAR